TSFSDGKVYIISSANTPPTISKISNVTFPPKQGSKTLTFTVGDAETPAADLTVTATSSNPTLLPASGIVLGGSGADRTITLTPAAGKFGDATVTVTVTDSGGLMATTTFNVHVPPALGNRGLVGHKHFAVGGDAGSGTATLFNQDHSTAFSVTPFPGF